MFGYLSCYVVVIKQPTRLEKHGFQKKIYIPISFLSPDKIYALLNSIESDEEEDIENVMNDSDTEFVDRSVVKNKDSNMHVDAYRKPQVMMLTLILSQFIYLLKH